MAKLARALRPSDDSGTSQLIYYHPGVGTGNRVDHFLGGAFGIGLSGNVQSEYAFLADNFQYTDQIFLFGFSRGAYTVRSLAGLIGLVGLMRKADMDYFPQVYKIYMSRKYREAIVRGQKCAVAKDALRALFPKGEANGQNKKLLDAVEKSRRTQIHFIGVWDTVGSLGVPYGLSRIAAFRYNFHDTDLSEMVNYAYQALAIDERRGAFPPTLWTRPEGRGARPEANKQVLEQVWFAGCHSNIGGGYEDCSLSDISFLWMVAKAAAAARDDEGRPLAFDEVYLRKKIDRGMGALVELGQRDMARAAEEGACRHGKTAGGQGNLRADPFFRRAALQRAQNRQVQTVSVSSEKRVCAARQPGANHHRPTIGVRESLRTGGPLVSRRLPARSERARGTARIPLWLLQLFAQVACRAAAGIRDEGP